MKLTKEIERRNNVEDDIAVIIGTEIKNRRLSMSLTLAALAVDTCSTSYLCKIEKAQINATDKRLEEICKRVGMTKTQYNDLLNLKKALTLVCDYYFYKDDQAINKMKNSLSSFSNYRSTLINYIIALYENNEFQIGKCCKKIISVIKEITDLDLLIFMTFYSIELLKDNKVVEASDNIKSIIDKNSNIPSLHILQLECLFECSYISDSPQIYKYYEMLKQEYFKNYLYDKTQKLEYKMAMHSLIHQNMSVFEQYNLSIMDKKYRYDLTLLKHMVNNDFEKMKNLKPLRLQDCTRLLYYYYFVIEKYKQEYKRINNYELTTREIMFFDYLNAKIKNNRFEFLTKEAIDRAINASDGFMMEYFLEALSVIIQKQGSYLFFYEAFKEIKQAKKILNQI